MPRQGPKLVVTQLVTTCRLSVVVALEEPLGYLQGAGFRDRTLNPKPLISSISVVGGLRVIMGVQVHLSVSSVLESKEWGHGSQRLLF